MIPIAIVTIVAMMVIIPTVIEVLSLPEALESSAPASATSIPSPVVVMAKWLEREHDRWRLRFLLAKFHKNCILVRETIFELFFKLLHQGNF